MTEFISIIAGIITLAIAIFAWLNDKSRERKGIKDALDKKINDANDADSIMRVSGELPPKS